MQELGVWITAEGTTPALLVLESDEWSLPGWASSALKGAVGGAISGLAGGPAGMLAGAAIGAAGAAAASAGTPTASSPAASGALAASAPPPVATAPATPAGGDGRTRVILALQQFAAVVPSLVQLVAASGGGGREFGASDDGGTRESYQEGDWGPESFQGTWTVP